MPWKPIQHCLNVQQRRLDVPIVAYFYTAQRASCYVDVNVTYSCSQYSQYIAYTYVRRPGVCVPRDSNYCPYYTIDSTDMQAHISYWDTSHSFCTPGPVGKIAEKILHRQTK